MVVFGWSANSQITNTTQVFEKDTFHASKGNLVITFIGHATLMIEAGNKVIYFDPVLKSADFAGFPKADFILITHQHLDHFDKPSIAGISKPESKIIVSLACKDLIGNSTVLLNGQALPLGDYKIEAVPAYNIVNTRSDGIAYHPKGSGNGYVISFGEKRIYVAGDTEKIPEMANLKKIDVAFLPVGLPYTMTIQKVADAARSFMPGILYPYHFDEKNPKALIDLLKDTPIQIRIRKMK